MSNLTTINGFSSLEVEAMQKLPEHQKLFVEAKNETKIINIDKQEVLTKIYALIIQTIELSGENKKYNLDNTQTKSVANFIYSFVCEQYKGITLSELRNAFKLGISNEYGDFVGFGTVTFTKFIKGYMNSIKREQAMKEWNKNQIVTTQVPITKFFDQNMELAKLFFEICDEKKAERFDTIYNHNDTILHLPSIYDFLFENYQISFSEESKEQLLKKAKIKYNNYINKSGLKTKDESGYKQIINSVKFGENRTFDYYVKTQALIKLVLKLKERGQTFNNLKAIK
jgi:hypothetical protein